MFLYNRQFEVSRTCLDNGSTRSDPLLKTIEYTKSRICAVLFSRSVIGTNTMYGSAMFAIVI